MKNLYSTNKGFTLIELLISTVILVFIITGMTIALSQQQRQFRFTNETVDIDQTARTLLDFIATEIRNAGARQGKNFSLQLVNGGSILDEVTRCTVDADTSLTGTINSPPDCLTISTWDIARGMINDPTAPEDNELNKRPSKVRQPIPPKLETGIITIDLPEEWFNDDGTFIGGTIGETNKALISLRSKSSLCHPNGDIDCLDSPGRCTQCAMLFEADINTASQQATISSVGDIVEENLPVTFTTVDEIRNGKDIDPTDSDPTLYGLLPSITIQPSEISIVKTKTIRLNPAKRELQLSEDGQPFESIAGGEIGTPGGLETPGIVDLQFVFHLQDPDGQTTRVGMCVDGTCNDINQRVFDDFSENIVIVDNYYGAGAGNGTEDLRCCLNREHDMRAVEIFLVVKSKGQPRKLNGSLITQNIRAIADVAERDVDASQSNLLEPEDGFIYKVFSTTVYLRNISTEDYG